MKQTLLIPREIAEWVEYCKSCSITLYGALDPVDKFGMSIAETFNGDALKCAKWARSNSNDFAYAWVNVFQECLSAGKIFRLFYLETNGSVLVNPSAMTIVVQEPKELTNG